MIPYSENFEINELVNETSELIKTVRFLNDRVGHLEDLCRLQNKVLRQINLIRQTPNDVEKIRLAGNAFEKLGL